MDDVWDVHVTAWWSPRSRGVLPLVTAMIIVIACAVCGFPPPGCHARYMLHLCLSHFASVVITIMVADEVRIVMARSRGTSLVVVVIAIFSSMTCPCSSLQMAPTSQSTIVVEYVIVDGLKIMCSYSSGGASFTLLFNWQLLRG